MTIKETIFVSYDEPQAKMEIPDQNVHMSTLMNNDENKETWDIHFPRRLFFRFYKFS